MARLLSFFAIATAFATLSIAAPCSAEEPSVASGREQGRAEAPESAPLRKMTLREALAHARAHHPQLAALRNRVEAARLDAAVPNAQWLPRVGGFAEILGATTNNSTTTLLNQPTVDIPRVGATTISEPYSLRPYPTTAVAVGIRQELYDFGRIAAERAAGELRLTVERYAAQDVGYELDFAIAQAYYAVLAAIAIEDASRNAFTRASAHRDLARAAVKSGLRPPIELTRAEADVAKYEAGMQRARGNLHVARGVFAAAVAVNDTELDAAAEPAAAPPLPTLNDALARAASTPLVQLAKARVAAQRAETASLQAQTRPNLFATASINGRAGGSPPNAGPLPPGNGFLPVVPNYHVGAVLSWGFFDPVLDSRADVSRARESALASESDYMVLKLRSAISSTWHEAEVARLTLDASERAAAAARANYDQAEKRFNVGLGTSTELADAEALRTEADIQLAIGKFQMARARAALDRAIVRAK